MILGQCRELYGFERDATAVVECRESSHRHARGAGLWKADELGSQNRIAAPSFETVRDSVAKLAPEDKRRLWRLLAEEIGRDEATLGRDSEARSEIREPRATYDGGERDAGAVGVVGARTIRITADLTAETEGGYSVYCPELDIYTQGESERDCLDNLREAAELHLEELGDLSQVREVIRRQLDVTACA